ncbi:hypothetical protein CCO03_14175 [Comamonas serinivorans]|uniref:Uncharacterized protein n=1 Tax=Comamonas serinivorans TaxID=1082851 RepID=A0A1Y0EQ97_9BURK|nr:hypothetical protein CCO03_14175 [Comamonas serinivorans]
MGDAAGRDRAQRIAAFCNQHAQELGMVLPRVRFKEAARLGADRYEIHLDGHAPRTLNGSGSMYRLPLFRKRQGMHTGQAIKSARPPSRGLACPRCGRA